MIVANHRIRATEVRVIDSDGKMAGVMPIGQAIQQARSQNLDLIEVDGRSQPPVCKILDLGKYKYEEKKKQNQARKNQFISELKELKLRPKTDDHDIDFKIRAARRFIETGHKVKFVVRFRGREITHPEKAREQLDIVLKELGEICNIEMRPTIESRAMLLIIAPKPAVAQKAAQLRAAAQVSEEKDRTSASPE